MNREPGPWRRPSMQRGGVAVAKPALEARHIDAGRGSGSPASPARPFERMHGAPRRLRAPRRPSSPRAKRDASRELLDEDLRPARDRARRLLRFFVGQEPEERLEDRYERGEEDGLRMRFAVTMPSAETSARACSDASVDRARGVGDQEPVFAFSRSLISASARSASAAALPKPRRFLRTTSRRAFAHTLERTVHGGENRSLTSPSAEPSSRHACEPRVDWARTSSATRPSACPGPSP